MPDSRLRWGNAEIMIFAGRATASATKDSTFGLPSFYSYKASQLANSNPITALSAAAKVAANPMAQALLNSIG